MRFGNVIRVHRTDRLNLGQLNLRRFTAEEIAKRHVIEGQPRARLALAQVHTHEHVVGALFRVGSLGIVQKSETLVHALENGRDLLVHITPCTDVPSDRKNANSLVLEVVEVGVVVLVEVLVELANR